MKCPVNGPMLLLYLDWVIYFASQLCLKGPPRSNRKSHKEKTPVVFASIFPRKKVPGLDLHFPAISLGPALLDVLSGNSSLSWGKEKEDRLPFSPCPSIQKWSNGGYLGNEPALLGERWLIFVSVAPSCPKREVHRTPGQGREGVRSWTS